MTGTLFSWYVPKCIETFFRNFLLLNHHHQLLDYQLSGSFCSTYDWIYPCANMLVINLVSGNAKLFFVCVFLFLSVLKLKILGISAIHLFFFLNRKDFFFLNNYFLICLSKLSNTCEIWSCPGFLTLKQKSVCSVTNISIQVMHP